MEQTMSISLSFEHLGKKCAGRLLNEVSVTIQDAEGPHLIECYREYNDAIHVPMGMDLSWLSPESVNLNPPRERYEYKMMRKLYSGKKQLEEGVEPERVKDQEEIVEEILEKMPDGKGSFMLALSTGMGKTTIAIHLASLWGRKTAVICPNLDILAQWEVEFKKTGVKVAYVTNPRKNGLEPSAVVYLMGVEMASKLTPTMTKEVGTVIVDEGHRSSVTCVTKSLLNFTPDGLLFLTATPHLAKAEKAFRLYVQDRIITRILKKTITVHKCSSGLHPDTSKKVRIGGGYPRLDYNHAMESIYTDKNYLPMMERFIRHVHSSGDGRTIVLFRRKEHINQLSTSMKDIPHSILLEKIKAKDCVGDEGHLILAIDTKAKEGVDIPGVKRVVLTFSGNDIAQPEGRSREDEFNLYIIIHEHAMFEKHWKKAESWLGVRTRDTYLIEHVDMTKI